MTRKQIMAQDRRNRLKGVEAILHPTHKIGNIDILHRHRTSGDIEFSAWQGENEVSEGRTVCFDKDYIISAQEEFYNTETKAWNYLIHGQYSEVPSC